MGNSNRMRVYSTTPLFTANNDNNINIHNNNNNNNKYNNNNNDVNCGRINNKMSVTGNIPIIYKFIPHNSMITDNNSLKNEHRHLFFNNRNTTYQFISKPQSENGSVHL